MTRFATTKDEFTYPIPKGYIAMEKTTEEKLERFGNWFSGFESAIEAADMDSHDGLTEGQWEALACAIRVLLSPPMDLSPPNDFVSPPPDRKVPRFPDDDPI